MKLCYVVQEEGLQNRDSMSGQRFSTRETALRGRGLYAAPAWRDVRAALGLGEDGEFEDVLADDASSVFGFDLDLKQVSCYAVYLREDHPTQSFAPRAPLPTLPLIVAPAATDRMATKIQKFRLRRPRIVLSLRGCSSASTICVRVTSFIELG
jgi:hypothetical protein